MCLLKLHNILFLTASYIKINERYLYKLTGVYINIATKKNPNRIYPTIKRGDAAIKYLSLVIIYYTTHIIYFTYIINA